MPQIRLRDITNTLRTVSRIRMRDATNTLRTIQRIRVRDATNTLRTVYQFLSVALSTPTLYGFNSGASTFGTVTSGAVTATVSGGTAPFTYAWEFVSGSLGITITTPTAASTTFSASASDVDNPTATYRCLVTDANGATAYSGEVVVELQWYDTR